MVQSNKLQKQAGWAERAAADPHWNFGPQHPFTPKATPTDGPCIHLAPIATVALGPKSTLGYRYWMVVGTKDEVTWRIDALLEKYREEKITLNTVPERS